MTGPGAIESGALGRPAPGGTVTQERAEALLCALVAIIDDTRRCYHGGRLTLADLEASTMREIAATARLIREGEQR